VTQRFVTPGQRLKRRVWLYGMAAFARRSVMVRTCAIATWTNGSPAPTRQDNRDVPMRCYCMDLNLAGLVTLAGGGAVHQLQTRRLTRTGLCSAPRGSLSWQRDPGRLQLRAQCPADAPLGGLGGTKGSKKEEQAKGVAKGRVEESKRNGEKDRRGKGTETTGDTRDREEDEEE
jgi:hypothetical protein